MPLRHVLISIIIIIAACGDSDPVIDAGTDDAREAQDSAEADIVEVDAPAVDAAVDALTDVGGDSATPDAPAVADMANLDAWGRLDEREGLFAFPGAEGYGQGATGGRGGDVVIVNTTADIVAAGDGLISLREAIESSGDVAPGSRTIVFAVGGVFDMSVQSSNSTAPWTGMVLAGGDDSNVSVACQTAPSPGVVIARTVSIWTPVRNLVWRHCKIREREVDRTTAGASRGMNINSGGAGQMIFDHMSISWTADGNFQVYLDPGTTADTDNITLSHSLLADGDGGWETTTGTNDSAVGPLCLSNSTTNRAECSFLYNLSANNNTRNNALWAAGGEILNSVAYNFWDGGIQVFDVNGMGQTDAWVFNNLAKHGPMGNEGTARGFPVGGRSQGSGNYEVPIGEGIAGAVAVANIDTGTPNLAQAGTVGPDIRELAANAGTQHMGCVGASRPLRDVHDQRVVDQFFAGSGPTRTESANPPRDFSVYSDSAHLAEYDSDNDGIADAWERMFSDDLGAMSHLTDLDADGYTDLEEFINQRARCD